MKKTLQAKIIKALFENGKPLNMQSLTKAAGVKKANELKMPLSELSKKGVITQGKSGWKPTGKGLIKAEVMRVFRAHGFIKNIESGEEFFVQGRKLMGSVPGDFVIAKITETERGEGLSSAAEVILITEESKNTLTGIIIEENRNLLLIPDSFTSEPLAIKNWSGFKPRAGDKVGFELEKRGERHREHTASITEVYGNSANARVCVNAYLDEKNIPLNFSEESKKEAVYISDKGIKDIEKENRLDLRDEIIFTIDGADTKDIDDAISIEKTKNGYKLGVHIADVSYYVKKNSALNKDAFERGTSVYIADMVIPMLPKELSNGICSLNPKEERLAFSCIMELNYDAEIVDFNFEKTVIKSRLQGVYSEINALLENNANETIKEKYIDVLHVLSLMKELADKLQKRRKSRGAPFIETAESKIICNEKGVCIDVQKRENGVSENIIEEFMLCANNCAARLAMEAEIPFVYRIHEEPTIEKIEALKETLLGIGTEFILKGRGASDLAGIIEKARNTEKAGVINMLVLRAMMKAKYSDEPLGHYGLVMKEYAHFTSPIRRYPDLAIHRILSDRQVAVGNTSSNTAMKKKYGKFAYEASMKSSHAELRAVNAERDCEKFYMAEFMQKHVDEEFDGLIIGMTQNSFFVTLANTVEGRVANEDAGGDYSLGDKVRVKCKSVNVAFGMIDFIII